MKTEKNILIAFILNISFSIFEFVGGIFTNSISITSDAIHDFGDAFSIGISYFLEKKSKRKPDDKYTYGYVRYSVLGAFITSIILVVGSLVVIYNAILRFINPVQLNYDGMIIISIIGIVVNFLAAYFTNKGSSLNQKAVNLHMLEDVLSWVVVFVGSILIKFTEMTYIDSIMSIGVAIFILINVGRNLKGILDLFLEKTPSNISIEEIKEHLLKIKDVKDIHHIHLWSIDGFNTYATMHIITNSKNIEKVKKKIKEELKEHGIIHSTIELETETEICSDIDCEIKNHSNNTAHHHHH